ncbi:MAG: phosphopentomutase, partial [Xanthomonadales bacterium]|nr:phosphopentomutase [Xanthomonadales bacterium]
HAAALAAGRPLPEGSAPTGFYGAASEISSGKDTPSGHWEIAGVPVTFDWGYFPETVPTFPAELTDAAISECALPGILGNCHASGTEIIARLGTEHMASGKPIVYTSADSVFQIAAHEESFGLERLYALCKIARRLCDRWNIGRVIARPFIGTPDTGFKRTGNRHDYSLPPPAPTLFDLAREHRREVIAIGKIADIFAHQGISHTRLATGHDALFDATLEAVANAPDGAVIATNFVDFDSVYGHRRDVFGYAAALEAFDARLPELYRAMRADDLVLLSADHGCDPTWPGSDHTREAIPLLAFGHGLSPRALGRRESFADIGQGLATHLGLPPLSTGTCFLEHSTP